MAGIQHRRMGGVSGRRFRRIGQWFMHAAQTPGVRRIAAFLLFQVSYFLAYKYGMAFDQSTASPFWFPDSVLLCALLVTRPGLWWILLLSTFPSRWYLNGPTQNAWFTIATSLNDYAKGVLVAWLLRRWLKNPLRFGGVGEYGLFCAVAVLIVPALSAFAGAACRRLLLEYPFWPAWRQWFLGNAAAHLIITPAILYGFLGSAAEDWKRLLKRWKESVPLLAALILASHSAFRIDPGDGLFREPTCYAPIPLLFWAAVRFGMLGASISMLIVEVFCIVPALHGHVHGLGESTDMLALRDLMFLAGGPFYLVAILGEQKRGVELSLMESEKRFRTIADTAPVMLWTTDTTKGCDFVNRGWLQFTGHRLEQEKGSGWAQALHPEDRGRCVKIYESHFDLREPFEMEYRLRRHDGEYRWVLAYGRPRYDSEGSFAGYIGSAIDITDRRKQETALRNSEERYREVVDSQTELMCRYLPDSILTFVNEAFCRFFGRRREQVIGRQFLMLLPEKARELAIERMALARATRRPSAWECEMLRPDGENTWHRWVNHPIFGPAGELEEFQCIGQDITDRKRAEELTNLLAHAQEEERRRIARDLHDDFSQRLAAHAIALSNLKHYIIDKGADIPALATRVDKLQGQAAALGEAIRLIAHQLHPPSIEQAGLEAALQSLCKEFRSLSRLRIDLRVDGPTKGLSPTVALCCFRLVQEGLRNVAKHARASEVLVKVAVGVDRVSLELADDGVGLNGHDARQDAGLGISSMRERVELLSGTFRIAQREPHGTVVTAVMPVGKSPAEGHDVRQE
jgi:PAS domain S-box-containing protein